MKDFDYSPKIVNIFKMKYNDCSENTKKEYIKKFQIFIQIILPIFILKEKYIYMKNIKLS